MSAAQIVAATGMSPKGLSSLQRRLDVAARDSLSRQQSAGASVLVMQHGRVVFEKGYGYASLELKVPATAETVYHIVGPTDQFTCIAIMQLVERGKLSLDQDIAGLVPHFPTHDHHITVRDLLAHTSGVPDYHYVGDPYLSTLGAPRAFDQVDLLFSNLPLTHAPGERYDWSVSDFQLMAEIIEHVSGQSFAQYMEENLYRPAGAEQTVYWDDAQIVPGLATSYRVFGDGFAPVPMDVMSQSGKDRFCNSVRDIYRVWRGVREGKLLRPQTLQTMLTPVPQSAEVPPGPGNVASIGLGIRLHTVGGRVSLSDAGSSLMAGSAFYEFPEEDLTVVALANTGSRAVALLAESLARVMLGLPRDESNSTSPAVHAPLVDLPLSAEQHDRLIGTYQVKATSVPRYSSSYGLFRQTIRVFEDNGRLMLQAWGEAPWRLLKQSGDTFASAAYPAEPVVFSEQDGVAILTLTSHVIGQKTTGPRVGPAAAGDFQSAALATD
jgi:CubicO group peptidase (beta-lactamase class C family)